MKTKKCFGMTVHICPVKDMPGSMKNVISVNAIWGRTPDPMRYWLLRWAYWRHSDGEVQSPLFADTMATRDYIKKGYSKKMLLGWFFKLLKHRESFTTVERMDKMQKRLKK